MESFWNHLAIISVWEGSQPTEGSRANPTDLTLFGPLNPAMTDASPAHVLFIHLSKQLSLV